MHGRNFGRGRQTKESCGLVTESQAILSGKYLPAWRLLPSLQSIPFCAAILHVDPHAGRVILFQSVAVARRSFQGPESGTDG